MQTARRAIIKVLPLITPYKQSDNQTPEKPPFKSQIQKPKPKTKSTTDEIFFIQS